MTEEIKPNPFEGRRQHQFQRGPYEKQTQFAGRRSPRGETPHVKTQLHHTPVNIDAQLEQWLCDRAAILGVSRNMLIRDLLALWANLVMEAERNAGIDYGLEPVTIHLPDRGENYWPAMLPTGFASTHLDDTPLDISEIRP